MLKYLRVQICRKLWSLENFPLLEFLSRSSSASVKHWPEGRFAKTKFMEKLGIKFDIQRGLDGSARRLAVLCLRQPTRP